MDSTQLAEANGYTVGEDLTVTPPPQSNPILAAAALTQAQIYAADIEYTVTQLLAHDQQIAAAITGHTAPLATIAFTGPAPQTTASPAQAPVETPADEAVTGPIHTVATTLVPPATAAAPAQIGGLGALPGPNPGLSASLAQLGTNAIHPAGTAPVAAITTTESAATQTPAPQTHHPVEQPAPTTQPQPPTPTPPPPADEPPPPDPHTEKPHPAKPDNNIHLLGHGTHPQNPPPQPPPPPGEPPLRPAPIPSWVSPASSPTTQEAQNDYENCKNQIINHNANPPDPKDPGAVAAYNSDAQLLNTWRAQLEAQLNDAAIEFTELENTAYYNDDITRGWTAPATGIPQNPEPRSFPSEPPGHPPEFEPSHSHPPPQHRDLTIEGDKFSASEREAANVLASRGHTVVPREALPTDPATSDLLVDGVKWDVYTPETGNINRTVGAVAEKARQVQGGGVVIDLRNSPLTPEQLGDTLPRVRGITSGVTDIIVLG